MVKVWLRRTTTIISVIAFLLQAASIAAPGWLIYVHGNIMEQNSLFYRWTLETQLVIGEERSKLESLHEIHFNKRQQIVEDQVGRVDLQSGVLKDGLSNAGSFDDVHKSIRSEAEKLSRVDLAAEDFNYNSMVSQQVLTVVATALSLMVVISQISQNIRKEKKNVRLMLLSAIASAISAGIVVPVVCHEAVYIHYENQLKGLDGLQAHTYISFPYCLALLTGSVVLHLVADITIGYQLYTPKIREIKSRVYTDDDDEDDDLAYVPPEKQANNEYKKPSLADIGHDNQVFSEKL